MIEPYRRKRRFDRTAEPIGGEPGVETAGPLRFVVQHHAARREHYDLRLELQGVLKSWAVPKGPSLDPSEKRLAVHVEDHPLEYAQFEGRIPAGEYGAGPVLLWDQGVWMPLDKDPARAYAKGKLSFLLDGQKLRGAWTLVRTRRRARDGAADADNWLLIKKQDEAARPLAEFDVQTAAPTSVATGRTLGEVGGRARLDPERLPRAVPAPLPGGAGASSGWVEPTLATAVAIPPAGDQWLHEIKFDGYRLWARLDAGRVRLMTRRGLDWTGRFPETAAAVATLAAEQALVDGELVALDPSGVSSFQTLQNALGDRSTAQLVYQVFDLLHLDGYDLRGAPLVERKGMLAELLAASQPVSRVRYADHLLGHGAEFFRQCCRMGLEGIVSKRVDRPYRGGRGKDWLKTKCVRRDEFVVGGFTEPSGSRKGLGAILVGYYDRAGELVYAGRVGTGFSEKLLPELRRRFDGIERDRSPFARMVGRPERRTHWIEPQLVAQIEYAGWTRDGLLRHAAFQGLREDKAADEVRRDLLTDEDAKAARSPDATQAAQRRAPRPAQVAAPAVGDDLAALAVRLTNPDRVLYAEQGITKLALAEYYLSIADWILPHLVDRPLALLRCPRGHAKQCFYHKHARVGVPPEIARVDVPENGGTAKYMMVGDVRGLIALVQMGVLEIHPWGSRRDRLDRPDRMVFDLDPDPEVPWERVVAAARRLRDMLSRERLTSFVKTTGGKGLHVVVPLERRHDWSQVKQFAKDLVEHLAAEAPGQYITRSSKAARRNRIYLDYLRNNQGATAIAAYSTRARPGAPVSVPLHWDELTPALRSDHFNVRNVPPRLAALVEDPWHALGSLRQRLPRS